MDSKKLDKCTEKGEKMLQARFTPKELRDASDFLLQHFNTINNETALIKLKIDELTECFGGGIDSQLREIFDDQIYTVLKNFFPRFIEEMSKLLNKTADTIESLEEMDDDIASCFR